MAEEPTKKIQRYVFLATFEHTVSQDEEESLNRYLTVIAPHFKRASSLAVTNTKDGETLVSLTKQNDAVV